MKNRDEKLAAVAEEIEVEMEIVGSTAIEDRLQDEVGQTIAHLKKAGIKVWVLTGDKIETAMNIGYSCQLLNNDMEQYIINGSKTSEILEQLSNAHREQMLTEIMKDSAIIISGEALIKVQKNERLQEEFINCAEKAAVVLACRVSPKQKADIVTMVKNKHPTLTTLAIGDGANDVNMITAAHVGVGISGLEGQQAARSSDYAIGQFKYLKPLLFLHGREAYRRNSYLVCYIFYKNYLFVLPQFWYGFMSAFSGQTLYEAWIYQMYNIMFSAFPVMWFALFDYEHPREHFLSQPKLFRIGLRGK